MPDFLLEIGLEEVPARMIASAEAELLKRILALLEREQLIDATAVAKSYSTPRRLAVLVEGVREQQGDITEETTGPAVKIAFKDGVPTPAAEAFARKSGVAVAELKTISTPKGDYLAATTVKKGRSAVEVIVSELPKEIAALYWAKNMRWIPGSNERFVRPVLWLACLLGEEVVPVEFAGKTAGRATYGHRILSSGEPFEIQSPASYLVQLEGEYVLADVEARRHKIRKALDHVCRTVPCTRWREDHDLVDAVTHLTEWPDVLLGSFEPAYLELPEEVLVTVMRDHQKYFAVEDSTGKLAPHFLTVTNIALDAENTPIIRQGNERVLRARFNDARFFWDFDQKIKLEDRVKLLENVTFQKDLGSYAKKSRANEDMAVSLAPFVGADVEAVRVASRLAKVDLTSELVKEFTELQGVIGGLYARAEGYSDTVADAIYNQYKPASIDEAIPTGVEAQVLGLADRFTTVVQMFRLGLQPTGSKDPFALRRAGNGIVRLLAESSLPLTLEHLFQSTLLDGSDESYEVVSAELDLTLRKFFNDRLESYLRDARDFSYGVVRGVLMAEPVSLSNIAAEGAGIRYGERFTNDVRDALLRAEALKDASGSQDFADVASSFKRIKGILSQAIQQDQVIAGSVRPELFAETVERTLYEIASATVAQVETYRIRRTREGYIEALKLIATLKSPIDAFFDPETGVHVRCEDVDIQANRLALLHWLKNNFLRIADFSEIVTSA